MLDSYLDGIRTIIITDNDLNRMKNRDGIIVDESLGIVAYKYSLVNINNVLMILEKVIIMNTLMKKV